MDYLNRRKFLGASLSTVSLALAGCLGSTPGSDVKPAISSVVSHYSPDCGCCSVHADYLTKAGIDVEVVEHSYKELDELKNSYRIPDEYRSCHTTDVKNGYVYEGHVPIELINEIEEEQQPDVEVVALPGMPSGSPGMGGQKEGEWDVYGITETGESSVLLQI